MRWHGVASRGGKPPVVKLHTFVFSYRTKADGTRAGILGPRMCRLSGREDAEPGFERGDDIWSAWDLRRILRRPKLLINWAIADNSTIRRSCQSEAKRQDGSVTADRWEGSTLWCRQSRPYDP